MIKLLIEFSLRKPLLNHFILLFIFLLSIFSYYKIPKEIFPPSSMDAITINGFYTGASSELLDKIAVSEIEDELLSLSSADTISSTIKNGNFIIKVDLKEGYKAKEVIDDVKDIITKAGINASRLNTIGQGEDNSVDANSKEARSLVRRVTFKLK